MNKQYAFTLIELLVYVTIGGLVLTAVVSLGINLFNARARARVSQEVNQNLRLVAERISFEIRNATATSAVTASSLTLLASDSAHSPVVIDLNSNRIRMGGSNLTSNLVRVSDLTFTNLSSGSASKHVQFSVTLEATTGRSEYQYSQTYRGSAELRSN